MKRIFTVLIVLAIFVGVELSQAASVFLRPGSQTSIMISSGAKTSSGKLSIGRCVFHGVLIATDGSHDAVVNLYDNTAASGKKIIPPITVSADQNYGGLFVGSPGVFVSHDIYLSISGTGASAVIYYDDGITR